MAKVFKITIDMTLSRAIILPDATEVGELTEDQKAELIAEVTEETKKSDPTVNIEAVSITKAEVIEI